MTMSAILNYFNLNKHVSTPSGKVLPDISHGFADSPETAQVIPVWKQITLYLGTVVGILFSPAITTFQAGKLGALSIAISAVIVSLIIAFLLMPTIFEKGVKNDAPFIVQLGLFVQHGVFWSVLMASIGKTFGG